MSRNRDHYTRSVNLEGRTNSAKRVPYISSIEFHPTDDGAMPATLFIANTKTRIENKAEKSEEEKKRKSE